MCINNINKFFFLKFQILPMMWTTVSDDVFLLLCWSENPANINWKPLGGVKFTTCDTEKLKYLLRYCMATICTVLYCTVYHIYI